MGFTREERRAQARAAERAEQRRAAAVERLLADRRERERDQRRAAEAHQRALEQRAAAERERARLARLRDSLAAQRRQQARDAEQQARARDARRPARAHPRRSNHRELTAGQDRANPTARQRTAEARREQDRLQAATRRRQERARQAAHQRVVEGRRAQAQERARTAARAESRRAAARRPTQAAGQEQARRQEQARALARQARVDEQRQAEARQRKLDRRLEELAARRRAELVAARRPPRRRLPSGLLSGPLPWLRASGPYLVDELDRPVTLRGVTASWLERAEPAGRSFTPPIDGEDLALLQSWGANVLGVPIAQDLALSGGNGAPPAAYLDALDRTIAAAAEAGLYTILRLSLLSSQLPTHADARGRDRFDPALPNMGSLDLWGMLARRYASEPAVIFDLFRSPHDPGIGDATGVLMPRVGWTLWRRWLLAMLGEVRRGHPRALVIVRGISRGRDLSDFPLTHTDGSEAANLLYGAELTGAEPLEAVRGLSRLTRDHPVAVVSWWVTAAQAAVVEAQGRRLARAGWHWLAAGWNGWEMPLVEASRGRLQPTALGRAFQTAMAQPQAPASNLDLAGAAARDGPRLATPDTKALSGRPPPLRDPFAPPGTPGNRWARYGTDGPIPDQLRARVDQGLDLAYKLAFQPTFTAIFAQVVSKLTGRRLGPDIYLDTLDRMVLHLADTARDPRIRDALKRDAEATRLDPTFQAPPAYSIPGKPNVWIKESQLRQPARVVAGTIIHEAAHVAGAPADFLAEIALEAIHNAGYPRR